MYYLHFISDNNKENYKNHSQVFILYETEISSLNTVKNMTKNECFKAKCCLNNYSTKLISKHCKINIIWFEDNILPMKISLQFYNAVLSLQGLAKTHTSERKPLYFTIINLQLFSILFSCSIIWPFPAFLLDLRPVALNFVYKWHGQLLQKYHLHQ